MGFVSVETRSVNHRFCDISLRVSRKLSPLEGRIRELIKSRFARGRFDLSVRLDGGGKSGHRVEPDLEMARQYVDALRTLKAKLRLRGEINLDMVAQARDIIVPAEDEADVEVYWEEIRQIVEHSLDALKAMRQQEGQGLAIDLRNRCESIRDLLEEVKTRAPLVLTEYRERLDRRLRSLTQGMDLDPSRLDQEVVLFAERSDIAEETVRIASHLGQLEEMMDASEPVGRKLEFLVQEIHREANTISSKASDGSISQTVVEIKGELERIREQIQNVE
jgi:uncharacterized protein (TIGR00255 family)